MGPSARSLASLEKSRAPAVRTMQMKMVDPIDKAAVVIAILLVEVYPIILRAP